jgi:hypothetical protein
LVWRSSCSSAWVAAPDHRVVGLDQEADRHDLHAVVFHRLHGLAVGAFGFAADAQHHRQARPVHIGIEDADRGPLGGQGQRQVHGRGALAHPALARGHGDDVLHLRQQLHTTLHRVRGDLHRQVGTDVFNASHRACRGDKGLAERREQALGRVAEFDIEGHVTTVDAQVADLLGRNEVLAGVRVDDGFQGVEQGGFGDGHGGGPGQ